MGIEYKKEFFDRDYTLREAYGRVWKYAKRYHFRLVIGIVSGMLTAGTLVPLFQVIQPTLEKVSQNEARNVLGEEEAKALEELRAAAAAKAAQPAPGSGVRNCRGLCRIRC